jgi:tetratricopeptide (TPR) repeat protein
MYHSSLNRFKIILAKGPGSRFFKSGLEWLFFIAHKTVNEQIVLDEVAKWSKQEFPRRFRSEFRYLLARYHFYRGKALEDAGQPEEAKKSLAEAKQIIWAVAKNDPFYSQAKYLQGSIHFLENDFESSLNSFREVVRFNNPRSNPDSDIQVRELAFMQLARIHYGHKQNRNAIFYYDKVKPGSDQWLEALFEASWAHFRIGGYERALGNLITLSSPFFRDEYFPETLILKAVIYYENCRYREARSVLEEFEKIYMPVHDELQKITNKNMEPKRYYAILEEIQKSNRKRLDRHLERILKLALTDTDFKLVNQSILELEQEMDSITEKRDVFRYSELAKAILSELKEERSALTARAGILAKAKLEFEIGQLRELLGNALRIRFETTTQEKKFLEDQLIAKGTKQKLKAYKYSVAVPDERVYWPFEGEYWRDELGTYEYTLTRGCQNR